MNRDTSRQTLWHHWRYPDAAGEMPKGVQDAQIKRALIRSVVGCAACYAVFSGAPLSSWHPHGKTGLNRLTLQCDALPLAQVDHETTPPPPSAKQLLQALTNNVPHGTAHQNICLQTQTTRCLSHSAHSGPSRTIADSPPFEWFWDEVEHLT